MEFNIDIRTVFDMELMESSFDLIQNPLFSITKRASWMMPTPFVLTDAVVIKQRIKPTLVLQTTEPISSENATQNTTVVATPINSNVQKKENVIIANDTIKVR
jgi:uncharacterized protein YajQ (UPF0234 family)